MSVHGVLQVHSAPPALCPHIEWAVAGVLGVPVDLAWVGQPAAPGTVRGELNWQARVGTAGSITSALSGWNRLRFEVTEEASAGCDPVRYSYTPALGTFCAVTGANGDIMIPENRLLAAMTVAAAAQSASRWPPPPRWRKNSTGCWGGPGTRNSSRSGARRRAHRCAGCTPPAEARFRAWPDRVRRPAESWPGRHGAPTIEEGIRRPAHRGRAAAGAGGLPVEER